MASSGFANQVKLGNGESVPVRSGRIYTTSALFAESRGDVHRWHTEGFLAVDMETAATFAVAEYFGMDRATLLYVYDCPRQGEHILLGDEDTRRRRLLGNERMIEIALMTVRKYSEQSNKS